MPAGSEVTLQLSPATQDPWTSIKVEAGGLLKAAGLNFLPESVSEAVVLDSTVSGSAVVDDDGFWLITMSMAPLDPTAGGNPVALDERNCEKLLRDALDGRLAV